MSTSAAAPEPIATDVAFSEHQLRVSLTDGREIAVPPVWFPRLWEASPAQLSHWRLIGRGEGIHWPDIDEDIPVEGLLRTA